MSFQSFSKLPPPTRHRPKNIPTLEFIALLNLICEDTPNEYDARNHVLSIQSMEVFEQALREKANRSLQSFEKQLKILGFKKHRELNEDIKNQENSVQYQKGGVKYYWNGKKEEYLNKELQFIEKHLFDFIGKVSNFRQKLLDSKDRLDKNFQSSLFCGLRFGTNDHRSENKIGKTTQLATETINWAHKTSGELVKDVQLNLQDQISLLRLLAFRNSEIFDD